MLHGLGCLSQRVMKCINATVLARCPSGALRMTCIFGGGMMVLFFAFSLINNFRVIKVEQPAGEKLQ